MRLAFLIFSVALIVVTTSAQGASELVPKPLFSDDPKGLRLQAAIPRMVDANGNVVWIDEKYTTTQYKKAASLLVLQEANRVAVELHLPEKVPITETDLVEVVVTPYGFNVVHHSVGSVTTKHFCYFVSKGNKFNELDAADYDHTCLTLRRNGTLPITSMDTNAAYRLAAKWLTATSMDIKGLNRDCKLHIALSPFWNGLTHLGEKPQNQFVPIYFVWWTSLQNDLQGHGDVAYVELYVPTKTLLQLCVSDSKYILRQPLAFTNLDSFMPGAAPIIKLPPPERGAQPGPG
ncbi:MAG TPA: hypothetical protein VNX46_09785 [Candidatus Acidoferrum sp.]|jgi:hypothetical protein|nr:hypothetical protein [Candidatus Acidoferrum sp.]